MNLGKVRGSVIKADITVCKIASGKLLYNMGIQ